MAAISKQFQEVDQAFYLATSTGTSCHTCVIELQYYRLAIILKISIRLNRMPLMLQTIRFLATKVDRGPYNSVDTTRIHCFQDV